MKKYLAIFIAALFVVGMSAFTFHKKSTTNYEYFHFKPASGGENAYETNSSWEVSETDGECTEDEGTPCIIRIDENLLADRSDAEAKVQSLVDFLSAQDGTGMALDAEDAVENYLVIDWKP